MRIGIHPTIAPSRAFEESTRVLLEVISERSHGLVHDDVRVAQLARATAEHVGLDEEEVSEVGIAARLRDIGNVAVPEAVLSKPGKLTMREWSVVRAHPEIGSRIIAAAPSLGRVAALVRSHHERYDGQGYPDGLAGEEIPIGACVVAMMRQRPFIDAITVVEAIAELQRGSGAQFHPEVVEAFQVIFNEFFQ